MSDSLYPLGAIVFVTLLTLVVGSFGYRISRTTSDFLVASRTVSPRWNASAISGEYLSAASFLGVAGLVMQYGAEMLWYSVGFTAGYLAMLLYVAAPLRRSGAYTLADFAELRLHSPALRKISMVFVVLISWLYVVPQLQSAGLTLNALTGRPSWLGIVAVALVITASVASGGMRSITILQAFQYWIKLTAICIPAAFLLLYWQIDGASFNSSNPLSHASALSPTASHGGHEHHALFATYSLILATFLGTMGLPHVLVRFYTNPNGKAARTTTLVVLCLVSTFYIFPPLYGVLGRHYVPELLSSNDTDAVVLTLPGAVFDGVFGNLLTAMVAAGAFAAFLSTSSGLLISVAGVLCTGLGGGSVWGFRKASIIAGVVPLVVALQFRTLDISHLVGFAFAVAASTFCPLLVLGIWWKRLTRVGAAAGMLVGGVLSTGSVLTTMLYPNLAGWCGALLAQPAAWTVPIAFAVMIVVSRLTPSRTPPDVNTTMMRLHTPESVSCR